MGWHLDKFKTKNMKNVLYFAYGSNMCKEQLCARIEKKYHTACKASLLNYRFIYNKKSTIDGTAKANIEACEGEKVFGVCYEIDENDMIKLQDKEKGYDCEDVTISLDNYQNDALAITFIANSANSIVRGIGPRENYRLKILKGAEEWGLPKEYIENYLKK